MFIFIMLKSCFNLKQRSLLMKKFMFFGAIFALVLMTGCVNKDVEVDSDDDDDTTTEVYQGARGSGGGSRGGGGFGGFGEGADAGETIGSVYFDFDRFNIRGDMQSVVDSAASSIRKFQSYQVTIEGNADERGTDEYNYALGTKRAIAVRDALALKGINPANIRVISFGESKPLCTEQTEECYQQNRRGDIRVIGSTPSATPAQ